MGNCCASPSAHRDGQPDVSGNSHKGSRSERRAARKQQRQLAAGGIAEGSALENGSLNSFLQAESSRMARSRSAVRRQVSRTTSIMSWKSAQSHLDDDDMCSMTSVDGGDERHHSELDGHSGGDYSPPGSPTSSAHATNGGTPATLRKAYDSKGYDSKAPSEVGSQKRSSLVGSLNFGSLRRNSTAAAAVATQEMSSHEKEPSPFHVPKSEFDAGMLAFQNKVFGANAERVADVPPLPVASWNRKPGYLGHLTPEHEAALAAMRSSFPDSYEFCTDHDMLRFLRARNFDLKASEEMFSRYRNVYRGRLMVSPYPVIRPTEGAWQLDLVTQSFPPRPVEGTELFQRAMRCFLHVMVFRRDRDGRPVIYMKVADIVKNSMGEWVRLADRLALQSAANEMNRLLCMMASAAAGYHIEEVMQVMDVSGVSILQMLKHIRSTENQAEFEFNSLYAPESLGKVVIVNGPFGGGQVWNLAKVFIPPSTREKISICSSDYKSTLEKYIHPDDIPSCYGGRAQMEWPKHEAPKRVYR